MQKQRHRYIDRYTQAERKLEGTYFANSIMFHQKGYENLSVQNIKLYIVDI